LRALKAVAEKKPHWQQVRDHVGDETVLAAMRAFASSEEVQKSGRDLLRVFHGMGSRMLGSQK